MNAPTPADRLPWFRFYPPDWRADAALRAVSLAARGLWIECLGLMHEATPRGYLIVGGVPLTVDRLALHVGRPVREVRAALAELERAAVCSVTNGAIYSRRMVRDTERAEVASDNGTKGGRPRKYEKQKLKLNENENAHPTGARFESLRSEDLDFGLSGVPEGGPPSPPVAAPPPPPAVPPSTPSPPPSVALNTLFADFWAHYPRRSGRKAAMLAFHRLKPDAALVGRLIDAIEVQRRSEQWRKGFIPHASTWLNGERWTDELDTIAAPQVGTWRDRCPHTPTCNNPEICQLKIIRGGDA